MPAFSGAPNRAGPIHKPLKILRILRTLRSLKEPKEHFSAYEELFDIIIVNDWTPEEEEACICPPGLGYPQC